MILKIKDYREEMKISQSDLARNVNNMQRNISNWENGASEPDCESIVKLADFFEISIDELFGRENVKTNLPEVKGVEFSIIQEIKKLTETQKFMLMQFLKEMNN